MLTLQIDNSEIETIFIEGFESNKEKFLAFIKNSYVQKASLQAYEADKERFMQTYKNMKNGYMKMYSESEAEQEIDRFLDTL
jgi:antitoxin component YwqK of YwqJK toxin-antitoxin module